MPDEQERLLAHRGRPDGILDLVGIQARAFVANALDLEMIRLAYNLVTAFQRTCPPEDWQDLTLKTPRSGWAARAR